MRYLPGLRQQGLDVRVFAGTPMKDDVTPGDVVDRWNTFTVGQMMPQDVVNGTPVHRVRLPTEKGWYRRLKFNQSLFGFCRNPAYQPDVLQWVGTIRVASIPWIRRLRGMGIATLYSVTTTSKVMRKRKWLDLRLLRYRLIFNAFDCIVTNNTPLGDSLRDMGVTSRIEIIPNGVDLERFRPTRSREDTCALRDSLGIGIDELMIVTVGAVIARKGSDLLAEAWGRIHREHPNTHLVFVGPRYDRSPHHREFQQRVDALAAESGAPERIHFAGLIDEVPDYLRAADIFVLPSKREGMPNSVIEAMACRTPVVMTPFVGLSDDLGQPEEQYLLAQHNPESLAETIGRLIRDHELRDSLAERALCWIKNNMAIERSITRYASLYKELAKR
jgi:glycosyltransferase involved in cell wall biosynthesis